MRWALMVWYARLDPSKWFNVIAHIINVKSTMVQLRLDIQVKVGKQNTQHGWTPKFNSQFAPEKWWLEDDPASFWDALFSGASC